jgi:hypothetical protein
MGGPGGGVTARPPKAGAGAPLPSGEPVTGPLARPVASMVAAAGEAGPRAHLEAATVARWFVAAGGARTPAELTALDAAFGDLPASGDVRPDRALTGEDATLPMLLTAGHASAAWRYYLAVMELAHATVALGVYPTAASLTLLDRLRAALLDVVDAAGVPRGVRGNGDEERSAGPPGASRPTSAAGSRAGGAAGVEPGPDDVEALLQELEALTGLAPVKTEVRQVADRLLVDRLRRQAGLPVPDTSRHLVFTGNPGTGKTTVARVIGRVYAAMGVIGRGHLVETGRDGLVAGFVGQTASRVTEVFDAADGGLLLIDEAYSLARGTERDFGREAIDAVVKLAEDRRDRVVVILAGYPDEMDALLTLNPGMSSRFPRILHFPDYTAEELGAIAEAVADGAGYRLTPAARAELHRRLGTVERARGFGNGRFARNLVESAIDRQATRVAGLVRSGATPDPRVLSQLRKGDLAPPEPDPSTVDRATARRKRRTSAPAAPTGAST